MDKDDVSDAILLFQFSQTARSSAERAPIVIRHLWDLFRRKEIGFFDLGKPNYRGSFKAGRPGFDLQINPHYIDKLHKNERLGSLSLLLVHEGVHAAVNFKNLYSELAARILSIHYYRELSGPGVFNEANDPPQPGKQWGVIRIAPSKFPEFQEQSDALRREQLLDYVLSIETDTGKTYTAPHYIDAQWVIDKLQLWGGLKNRWATTKGLYIRLLAKTLDPHYAGAILEIMESVERREDWMEAMKEAGALHTVQLALDELSTGHQFSARIVHLERKWGLRLTEEPPRR
jgi:hypothetical protein